VGGGIPIIRPMQTDLASNEILSVSGILNGTTNFILTKMKQEGAEFADALKEAQAKGFAEANPAADVEGLDAARKIVILSALAYGKLIDPNTIPTEGITKITSAHTAVADKFGASVKLIGRTRRIGERVYAAVSPYLVPASNPICHVDGVFNGILVEANMLGRALFYGAGAGKLPTASAVVADIIDILSHRAEERRLPVWVQATEADVADPADYVCRYCYLIEGCPKCAAKAKAALETETCEFICEGKFAVISKPTTKQKADEALAAAGLEAVLSLPVLD
jgi:homoserine dehydrogenase